MSSHPEEHQPPATGPGWTQPAATGPGWTQPAPPAPPGPDGPGQVPPAYPGSQPGYGPPAAAPGQPAYGQPAYGQPVYGQLAYGQPAYGQPGGQPGYAAALRPGVVPLRPLSLGEILDGAFRSVRANPGVMFGLTIAVVAVAVALQSVLQWYLQGVLAGQLGSFGDDPFTVMMAAPFVSSTAQVLAQAPTLGLAVIVLTGLLIVSVTRSVIGRKASAREVWEKVRRRIVALVVVAVLIGLATAVPVVGWAALLWAAAVAESIGALLAVFFLGGLGLIVFFVWFVVRTVLIPAAIVVEDLPLGAGIARGWRLTRGSFWRILGTYAVTFVIVAIASSLILVPGSLVSTVFFDPTDLSNFAPIAVLGVFNIVAMTVSTVFTAAVVALIYVDVRMRHEGLDVVLAKAATEGHQQ